uniref:CHK kinase-like domain-containing protein n=1 Tax=Anopheles atroparvus TaxID=41427 RepID=A0AAG5DT89_ANOAO
MSTATEGTMALPSYLTESLIKRSLENDLQRPVTIESFTAGPATVAGDNYLSDVFWIRVLYDGGASEKRLLAKCMPDVGDRGATLDILDAFRKESSTFLQVLPEFTRVVGTGEQFGAKCYYATADPVRTIVFEDLKALGFRMCDRTQGGLDYAHLELVMRKIGKFHAASMLYAAQSADNERQLRERYSYGFYNPQQKVEDFPILSVFQKGLEKFVSVAAGWPELEAEVVRKLQTLRPTFKQRIADCVNPRQPATRLHVLNHGDLWSNNLMFRYEDSTVPREVMFVDYQLSCYGSPGLDLVYSLYNCPRADVRQTRLDDLLTVYYRSLCEVLELGNYSPIPTRECIKQEYEQHEFFGLVCAVSLLPILLMERSDDVDISFDAFFDQKQAERIREIQYNGTQYREAVVPMLQSLHARGYIQ